GGGVPADLHLIGDVRGRRGAVADRAARAGPAAIARPSRIGTWSAVLEWPDRRRSHLWDRPGGDRGRSGLRGRARRAGARLHRARESAPLQHPRLRAVRTDGSAALLGGPARAVIRPSLEGRSMLRPYRCGAPTFQHACFAWITMRVVSLLPAATEIVAALGAGSHLVGVTHE